jgi:hypothetical protein
MKQETNNEMDLLLRRLARRDDASASDAGGDHLDADELSAYAENALPAAARARYMTHLADCSRCRGLVVQLGSSAGVVATTESAKVSGPSGLKKFFASLFTPMVMRYAAPALGLIVVAAIGFVALRQQAPQSVARLSNGEQRPTSSPVDSNVYSVRESATSPTPTPGGLTDKQGRTVHLDSASVPNAPPTVSSVNADVSKDKEVAQAKPDDQAGAVAANEPPPPPKAAATTVDETAKTEVNKKEVREQPAVAPQAAKTLGAAEREDKDNFARKPADSSARGIASTSAGQRDKSVFRFTGRTVAGRQFQREGGVWIDTAYDSSKDVVTVARDSEQYRALVADEPQIKTIADSLDGEIIVVWKGRTYRIR